MSQARDFASLARTMHRLSIRCEKHAVEYPKHAESLLEEARYKRRASWIYLRDARWHKEQDDARAIQMERAA